jgi:hypothetical protein
MPVQGCYEDSLPPEQNAYFEGYPMSTKAGGLGFTGFSNLSINQKWLVVGGVVSMVGVAIAALNLWVRVVPNPPQNGNANQPVVNQAINGGVIVNGNQNRIEPAPVFVRRALLKADSDGQPPRVLTMQPSKKAVEVTNNSSPEVAMAWLVKDGFFCPAGTEVELIPSDIERLRKPPLLALFDTLHTKIRVLDGDNKGKEGWILTKLIEWKQERQ